MDFSQLLPIISLIVVLKNTPIHHFCENLTNIMFLESRIILSNFSSSLQVLTTSGWNPPPGYRKLHGDLMYLQVITLEDKQYYLTACARGFFVNQSSKETFNPKPASRSHLCHSLIELLNQLSPAFKRGFAAMQRRRTLRHPFERVATPYQLYAWSAPQTEHTIDAIRAEDSTSVFSKISIKCFDCNETTCHRRYNLSQLIEK